MPKIITLKQNENNEIDRLWCMNYANIRATPICLRPGSICIIYSKEKPAVEKKLTKLYA